MKNKSLNLVVTDLSALDDDDIVDVGAYPALTPFVGAFPDKFFEKLNLTKSQLLSIIEGVALTIHTNRTLPVLCRGCDCPIRHICPLDKGGVAPLGHECAIERISMVEWRAQYIEALDVDLKDKIQLGMIDELVEIDIFNKYRFPAILSENMTAFQETVETFSDKGGSLVQSRKEVSKAFDAKMAMARRREIILRELLATPMQKVKHKLLKKKDAASDMNDISAKAEIAIETIDDENSPTDAE